MTITSRQVKAARELLGWSQAKLATKASMTLIAIQVLESKDWFSVLNTTKIQVALEAAGIEFVEGEPGVKLRKAEP